MSGTLQIDSCTNKYYTLFKLIIFNLIVSSIFNLLILKYGLPKKEINSVLPVVVIDKNKLSVHLTEFYKSKF